MSTSELSSNIKKTKAGTINNDTNEEAEGASLGGCEQQLLVDNISSIIMTVDNHLRITYMNQYGLEFFGYSPMEILGKSVMGITIPFKDAKGTDREQMAQDIIRNPQKYKTNVHKNMRKDGKLVWVSWTNSPRYSRDGDLIEILAVGNDITELKKAKEALRQSEERRTTVFTHSGIGIALADLDGNCIETNPALQKILGYSAEELRSVPFKDYTYPDDVEVDLKLFNELVAGKRSMFELDKRYIRKDGEIIWAHLTVSAIKASGGKVRYVLGMVEDISERKKAEATVKENERLYKAVFDNSQDGFLMAEILYDTDGRPCDTQILKVNNAFTKQSAIKGIEVVGKRLSELGRSIDQSLLETQNTVLRTGKSIHFENYSKNTERYYDTYMFPITRTIFGQLFRDITESKKAQEAVECSNRRINEILESISDDFMVLDRNWNYVYANRQAAKLVGLEPKTIVGKNFWELFPQNKGTFIEQNLREAMENREIRRFELFGQYSKMHKLITTYPSVEGIVLIATDITERKNLEDQLHEKERLAAIGATAGMVGHDIRNPLQAMLSDVFLLKDYLSSIPQTKTKDLIAESLEGLEKNIGYVNKIVADLQDYARPLKPEYSLVNLTDLIASVFKTVELPDNVKLSIDVKVSGQIETEATFIRRSLTNLVNNAIQAMPQGGNLTLTVTQKGGKVIFTVQDTGVGIPENVKPKLFLPMTTTKSKGQGLGLAVTKRLVEALKGTISFESQEGKGTKFLIELPLKPQKTNAPI